MKKRLISAFLAVAVLAAVFGVPAGAAETEKEAALPGGGTPGVVTLDTVRGVHPRIFVRGDDVQNYRQKIAQQGNFQKHWVFIRDKVDKFIMFDPPAYEEDSNDGWMRDRIGNNLGNIALACLMSDDPKYLEYGEKLALAACSYPTWGRGSELNTSLMAGHILTGLGLFYDWTYDRLSAETRTAIRDTLIERGNIMYQAALDPSTFWAQEWLQNHMFIKMCGLMMAGMAIFDEYPDAQKWFDQVNSMFEKTMLYIGDDGASQEGMMYCLYGMQFTLCYMDVAREYFGRDYYDVPWFQNAAKQLLYFMLPENYRTVEMNHFAYGDDEYPDLGQAHFAFKLAKEYNDGYAQYLGRELFDSGQNTQAVYWTYILWYSDEVTPIPPDDLPATHHFDDMDIVSMRSDWSGSESAIQFKCGPYTGHKALELNTTQNPIVDWGGGHAHPDAAHFSVYGYGDFQLIDDTYSHKFTAFHNSLLINNKGQIGEGSVWFKAQDAEKADSAPRITKVESGDTYDYTVGDATKAYSNTTGLTKFKRHLLYLKPDVLIVADDIASTIPSDLELRFFPKAQKAIAQSDGSYYLQNTHSKLLVIPLQTDGAEFAPEVLTLYSGKENTTMSTPSVTNDSLAMRAVKRGADSWVNVTAFSWSSNESTPVSVKMTGSGNKMTFDVLGEQVTLDLGTEKVTLQKERAAETELWIRGKNHDGIRPLADGAEAYLPAREFAAEMGGAVEWRQEEQTARITLGDKVCDFAMEQTGVRMEGDTMYLRTDAIESQYDLIVRYNQNANRVSVVDLPSSGSSAQAELVDILIDGKQVKNFEPDRFEYEIVNTWGTAVPQVDVVPREITTKFNMQLEGQDRIVIQAESKDGRVRNDYVFKIAPYLGFGNVTVEKITDLGEETPEKSGGNAMDGDLSTNSTTEGDGIPMEFDFGREVSLSAVGIACYIGNTRKAFFEFQSSLDGQSWQKVFDGSSSGTTSDFEYYDMKNTRARYVRMIGHGNSTNLKNSFYEICFLTGTNFLTAFHLEGEAQMKAEETQLLTPAGVMFGGTPADFSKGALSYSSSDPEVASVDAEGRVTALKKGTATITASFVLEDMTSTARLGINVTDGTFMNEDFESYADGYGLNLPWGSTFGDAENQACAAKLPDGRTAVRLTATTPSIYPYISYPIKCKGKVVVEFDVMSDSMMGEKRIQFTPTGTGYLPFIRIGDTGDFYAYDSDNWVRLRTYRPGKWYHFKALVDTEAQRYDVWVDQVQYGRDLAFKPDQGNGKLYDWSNGLMTIRPDIHVTVEKSASFYMDNFKVYEYQETEGTSK